MKPSFAQRNSHAKDWGRNPKKNCISLIYTTLIILRLRVSLRLMTCPRWCLLGSGSSGNLASRAEKRLGFPLPSPPGWFDRQQFNHFDLFYRKKWMIWVNNENDHDWCPHLIFQITSKIWRLVNIAPPEVGLFKSYASLQSYFLSA